MQHDGMRVLQPLADPTAWFGCFDVVQLNEDEMRQLSPDPLSLSAQALGAGTSLLVVTLGPKGAAYVAAPGFDGMAVAGVRRSSGQAGRSEGAGTRCADPSLRRLTIGPLRPPDRPTACRATALIPAPAVDALDPTGCGDVFGAAACARLLAGDQVEDALRHADGDGRAQRHAPRRRRPEPPPPRGAAGAMTRVVEVPATFDDRSFEQFAGAFGAWPPEEKILIDARGAQWASPYGLLAMLTAGQALAEAKRERPLFTVPTQRRRQALLGPRRASSTTRPSCSSCTARCRGRPRPGRRTCCST